MPRGVNVYNEAELQKRLWSPEELRPLAWFDASDISTLTLGASGITAWRDKLRRSALTLTATNNPVVAAVNAPAVFWTPLPVVVFNGTSHLMTGAAVSNYAPNTGYSSVAVVRVTNTNGWTGLGDGAPAVWTESGGGNVGMVARTASGRFQAGNYLWTGADRTVWADLTSSTAPEAGIIYVEYASTSSYTVTTNMSAAVTTGNPTAAYLGAGSGAYRMGASYTSRYLGMELGELLHFGFALSPAQRAKVEGYLAWKWSQTANKPAAHPFRNRPPLIGD